MFTSHTKVGDIPCFTQLVSGYLVQSPSSHWRSMLLLQMDDGYLEQFPIGAINHIGLPESTLPKEVNLQTVSCCSNPNKKCHQGKRRGTFLYAWCALQVIQVLPSDYYAQLEVAHHISCYAFSSKVRVAFWTCEVKLS